MEVLKDKVFLAQLITILSACLGFNVLGIVPN